MRIIMGVLGLLLSLNVWATIDAYPFVDSHKEAEFNELINELRCPKCQNQTISDSDAPLAKDLKDKTYKMLQAGQDKQSIIDYMIDRYGYFVYYQPPVKSSTWVLWFGPFLFLAVAVVAVVMVQRGKRGSQPDSIVLTESEQARLAELTQNDEKPS